MKINDSETGLSDDLKRLQKRVSELEETERRLYSIVEGTASYASEDFLNQLTRRLAKTLNVRFAFIAELYNSINPTEVRLVSFWTGNGYGENFSYSIKDTPCGHVVNKKPACFPSKVRELFPEDAVLKNLNIDSYMAVPLFDPSGGPVGHMGVMDVKPMENNTINEDTLRIFAAHASSEILKRRAEAERDRFFMLSPDIMCIAGADGYFKKINPAFVKITGYDEKELLERQYLEFIHPDDRLSTIAEVKNLLDGRMTFNFENRYICKDGSIKWLSWKAAGIVEEGLLYAVARDVTEDRLKNEVLRDSEEKYRKLFENTSNAVMVCDAKTLRFEDANIACLRLYGYTKEEFLSLSPEDVSAEPEKTRVHIHDVIDGRTEASRVPLRYHKKKDGTSFPVALYTGKFFSKGREKAIGVIIDLTESKLAEEALRKSESLFRNLAQVAPSGIFQTDASGECTFVSNRWVEITGMPFEDAVGGGWQTVIHPGDMEKILGQWAEAVKNKSPFKAEYRLLNRKNGKAVWIVGQAIGHYNEKNRLIGYIGTITDITWHKLMEDELLRVKKIESIGLLAGGIAHDFNNVMSSILLNISSTRMFLKPEDALQEKLSDVEKEIVRAKGLTRQLLTFSKGGAPIRRVISVAELLKDAVKLPLSGSNIKCDVSITDGLWPMEADEGQIHQVISNLLINSRDAMQEGGVIHIRCENYLHDPSDNLPLNGKKFIRITIKDNGIGISMENLNRIFDPFFTTKTKGTGLGLSTAYSIIKRHNGYVAVNSKPGSGTTFYIYLPATDKEIHIAMKEENICHHAAGKILIMDDEEKLRNSIAGFLKKIGYEIEIAETGAEAIERYSSARESKQPFNAVILDLTVPGGIGGVGTLKRLMQIDPGVKAIVSSGYSDDDTMSEFKEVGFKGIIAKPYNARELREVLHKVLSGID